MSSRSIFSSGSKIARRLDAIALRLILARTLIAGLSCTLVCSLLANEGRAQISQFHSNPDQAGEVVGIPSISSGSVSPSDVLANSVNTRVVLPAESLGSSDLIEITVPYCPELSHSFRVGSDGLLVLPVLHQPIRVSGLTPSQTASRIREELIAEQVMPDPTVNVSVLEYRSRTVSIVGAVLHPLTFQAAGEITLLDAIAMAGGFGANGATDILVSSRHVNSEGTIEVDVKTIPVRGLLLHANATSNIVLRGGEVIRVTEAGKVFIAGNVAKPGAYTMQGDEDTTVIKALALSGGLREFSSHDAYIYRLRAGGGEREEIKVPLARIVGRKDADVDLIADDILYVPGNNGKRLTVRVLEQIAGFGQTAGAGLLIYR